MQVKVSLLVIDNNFEHFLKSTYLYSACSLSNIHMLTTHHPKHTTPYTTLQLECACRLELV